MVGGGEVAQAGFGGGDEGFDAGDLLFGVVEAVFELPELDGIAGPRGFEDTLGLQDYRQFCGFPGGEATGDLE